MNSSTNTRTARQAIIVFLAGAASLCGMGSIAVAATPVPSGYPATHSASWCGDSCDQVVMQWNFVAYKTIHATDGYSNPLPATRSLAMMHLAMHDAVNQIRPRFAPYASDGGDSINEGADPAVAAIVAAHDVLAELYPEQKAMLRGELAAALLDAGAGTHVDDGRSTGARAAAAVLARRADDGHDGQESYQESNRPGRYRFVPRTDFIAMPHWRKVTPFALRAADQFRVSPPPALESHKYAEAWYEVKMFGGKSGATRRTAEQASYANFWYELSDVGWNRIARVVSRERKQDLWERARVFALLNAALADSYVAGWESKLHHDWWRPVSAIRLADKDRNPWTVADPAWEPLLPTPPIQDHPSTHSVLGAAAARVLAHGFGRDDVAFAFSSPTALPGESTRRFSSFSEAALENGDSRVRAGLHFRFAVEQGLALGARVGDYAVTNLLAPAHQRSAETGAAPAVPVVSG